VRAQQTSRRKRTHVFDDFLVRAKPLAQSAVLAQINAKRFDGSAWVFADELTQESETRSLGRNFQMIAELDVEAGPFHVHLQRGHLRV
jgi:hypothetical protein